LTLDGALFSAPIGELPGGVHNALDIATGTGTWAMEFGRRYSLTYTYFFNIISADEFPSAKVIGTDLSPIQPEM
jgi:ubiquinone/menaquinone biosynthesis C-methylase UbiE